MNPLLKKPIQYLWFLRGKFAFTNFPLLCRLPFGAKYLAYGDGMGLMFFFHRPFEQLEWPFVAKSLKPGMTFFDVGANQGFYTLLGAQQVGKVGRVVSFEPIPNQIKKLQKNVAINHFDNVITEQLAVGASEGFSDMYVCRDGDEALSSLRLPAKEVTSKKEIIKARVTTLDDYVQKHNISSIDFIKIDVEGGELPVLQGATNILKHIRPVLMCEVQDIRTLPWGYQAFEICKLVEQYNYMWFKISRSGMPEPYQVAEGQKIAGENLIAIPVEKNNYVKNI